MKALKTKKVEFLSDRIAYALELTGVKKADLAKNIGVKPQVINFLSTNQTKSSRFTFEIAAALGLNAEWLATGIGEMFIEDDPIKQLIDNCTQVPILELDDLIYLVNEGEWHKTNKNAWAVITPKKHDDIFALKMLDASMSPYIPVGSIVFFDYQKKEINDLENAVGIIYSKKFNSIMIRKISKRNDSVILEPTNTEMFKTIHYSEEDMFCLGLAFEWHYSLA